MLFTPNNTVSNFKMSKNGTFIIAFPERKKFLNKVFCLDGSQGINAEAVLPVTARPEIDIFLEMSTQNLTFSYFS